MFYLKRLKWKLLIQPKTIRIVKEDKESAKPKVPKNFTIVGNLDLAVLIALDTVAFLLFNLVAGVVFLLVALIGTYGVLKFLGCLRPC